MALFDSFDEAAHSAELEVIKHEYRDQLRTALHDVLGTLSIEERNLLRFACQGLTVDEVATILCVHRATAARRIGRVREMIFARLRQTIVARIGVRPSDADSLLRLVRSELVSALSAAAT